MAADACPSIDNGVFLARMTCRRLSIRAKLRIRIRTPAVTCASIAVCSCSLEWEAAEPPFKQLLAHAWRVQLCLLGPPASRSLAGWWLEAFADWLRGGCR